MVGRIGVMAVLVAMAGLAVWLAAADWLSVQLYRWADGWRKAGHAVSFRAAPVAGFPARIRLELQALTLSGRLPSGPVRIEVPHLALSAPVWHPWSIGAVAGDGIGLRLDPPGGGDGWRLTARTARQSLDLRRSGRLRETVIRLDRPVLSRLHPAAPVMLGEAAQASVAVAPAGDGGARLRLDCETIRLPASVPGLSGGPARLAARLRLRGSFGMGSAAELEAWRAVGGAIEFEDVRIDWPPAGLRAEGRLGLDAMLRPAGTGNAEISGADRVIDGLAADGVLSVGAATAARLTLLAFGRPAEAGDGRPVVRIPLAARDGALFAGPWRLAGLRPVPW